MLGYTSLWAALWLLPAGELVSTWPDKYFLMAAGLLLSLGVARRFERR